MTESTDVRVDWGHEVATLCQRAVPIRLEPDPEWLSALCEGLAAHLPAPKTPVERSFLTDRLRQFTSMAGRQFDRRFHKRTGHAPCDGTCLDEAERVWTEAASFDDPRIALRLWPVRYRGAFDSGHSWPVAFRAATIVRSRFTARLPLDEVARAVGCSRSVLTRRFSQEFAMSVREFQTRLRIREAVRLLQTTPWTVECVAGLVGYRSPTNLHEALRSELSLTPGQVRVTDACLIQDSLERSERALRC
jgi:AraC-like DNA-binding protein